MTRACFHLLLAGCSTLGACAEEISVGNTRDDVQVREDEDLEHASQELGGVWVSLDGSMKITFTPGALPRSGNFVGECMDGNPDCNPLSWLSSTPPDAGGLVFLQPMGQYRLVDQFADGVSMLCVLIFGDKLSIALNLSLSASGNELAFAPSLGVPLAARFVRQ